MVLEPPVREVASATAAQVGPAEAAGGATADRAVAEAAWGARGGIGVGNRCLQPVSAGVYGCAATYEEQLAKSCLSGGGGVVTGACGTGWGWRCRAIYVQDCVYDSQRNLIAARWCDDVPSCGGTSGADDSSYCKETSPSVADFGTCIQDIGRPATGCAPAGSDAGTRCCGDGTLPPTGPPYFCRPTYTEQRSDGRCAQAGACGNLLVTSDSNAALSYSSSCHYNSSGVLVSASRCDAPTMYCGSNCIRSALTSAATAYVEPPCGADWATDSCAGGDAGRD